MVDYMRISDWSSDVCSSDLETGAARFFFCKTPDFEDARFLKTKEPKMSRAFVKEDDAGTQEVQVDLPMSEHPNFVTPADRKSVVSGKSVSVRVDIGGRRIIKKKKIIDIVEEADRKID